MPATGAPRRSGIRRGVGLIEGYSRFDARRDLQFKTFAEHRIRGAIIDYLRRLDPLPRDVRRFQKKCDAAILRLSQHHKRQASEQEIADELGITVDRYRKLAVIAHTTTISLDEPRAGGRPIGDVLDPASLSNGEYGALSPAVAAAIEELPEPARTVVMAVRHGENHRTIAKRLHVTEGRVSQIKRSALERLRTSLSVRTPA